MGLNKCFYDAMSYIAFHLLFYITKPKTFVVYSLLKYCIIKTFWSFTHTRTHARTRTHMHTDFPDKTNFKKPGVCMPGLNFNCVGAQYFQCIAIAVLYYNPNRPKSHDQLHYCFTLDPLSFLCP